MSGRRDYLCLYVNSSKLSAYCTICIRATSCPASVFCTSRFFRNAPATIGVSQHWYSFPTSVFFYATAFIFTDQRLYSFRCFCRLFYYRHLPAVICLWKFFFLSFVALFTCSGCHSCCHTGCFFCGCPLPKPMTCCRYDNIIAYYTTAFTCTDFSFVSRFCTSCFF